MANCVSILCIFLFLCVFVQGGEVVIRNFSDENGKDGILPMYSNAFLSVQLNTSFVTLPGLFNGRAISAADVSENPLIHLAKIPSVLTQTTVTSDRSPFRNAVWTLGLDLATPSLQKVSLSEDGATKVTEEWYFRYEAAVDYKIVVKNLKPVAASASIIVENHVLSRLNQSFEDLTFLGWNPLDKGTKFVYQTKFAEFPDCLYGAHVHRVTITLSNPLPQTFKIPGDSGVNYYWESHQYFEYEALHCGGNSVPISAPSFPSSSEAAPSFNPNLLNAITFKTKGERDVAVDKMSSYDIAAATKSALFYIFSTASAKATFPLSPNSNMPSEGPSGYVTPDLERHILPIATLFTPHFAKSLLSYRTNHMSGAKKNAELFGADHDLVYRFPLASAQIGVDVLEDFRSPNATPPNPHRGLGLSSALALYPTFLPAMALLDHVDYTGEKNDFDEAVDIMVNIFDYFESTAIGGANHACAHTFFPVRPGDSLCLWGKNVSSFDAHTARYSPATRGYVGTANNTLTQGLIASTTHRLSNALRKFTKFGDKYYSLVYDLSIVAASMSLPTGADGIHPEYEGYAGQNITQSDVAFLHYPLGISYSSNAAEDRKLKLNELFYYINRTDEEGFYKPSVSSYIISLLRNDEAILAGSLLQKMLRVQDNSFHLWGDSPTSPQYNHLPTAAAFLQILTFGFGGIQIYPDYLAINPVPVSAVANVWSMTISNIRYRGILLSLEINENDVIVNLDLDPEYCNWADDIDDCKQRLFITVRTNVTLADGHLSTAIIFRPNHTIGISRKFPVPRTIPKAKPITVTVFHTYHGNPDSSSSESDSSSSSRSSFGSGSRYSDGSTDFASSTPFFEASVFYVAFAVCAVGGVATAIFVVEHNKRKQCGANGLGYIQHRDAPGPLPAPVSENPHLIRSTVVC
eukprot:GCRY01001350.1.p1 GENE.GCRY01001350.1~~GCRY01001350.1.p1  ORF type:complete len:917 (+),score=175.99 GCRY01001350.1:62-2812(+)